MTTRLSRPEGIDNECQDCSRTRSRTYQRKLYADVKAGKRVRKEYPKPTWTLVRELEREIARLRALLEAAG